jgi:hypothetical protein
MAVTQISVVGRAPFGLLCAAPRTCPIVLSELSVWSIGSERFSTGTAMSDLAGKVCEDAATRSSGMDGEAISLLLEEYKALRAEVTQRIATRAQIAGLGGVMAALLVASTKPSLQSVTAYGVAIVVLVGWLWWRDASRGLQRVADHLCMVERRLNRLAREVYGVAEDVFTWEQVRREQRAREGRATQAFGRLGGWRPANRRETGGSCVKRPAADRSSCSRR